MILKMMEGELTTGSPPLIIGEHTEVYYNTHSGYLILSQKETTFNTADFHKYSINNTFIHKNGIMKSDIPGYLVEGEPIRYIPGCIKSRVTGLRYYSNQPSTYIEWEEENSIKELNNW